MSEKRHFWRLVQEDFICKVKEEKMNEKRVNLVVNHKTAS